jgi:hypothetical protein
VISRLERQDAVIPKSGGTSPDHDITVSQPHAEGGVGSTQSPEQEDGGQPERDGHDRRLEVPLVPILVERESPTRLVPVDETGVGLEGVESCRAAASRASSANTAGIDGQGRPLSGSRPS